MSTAELIYRKAEGLSEPAQRAVLQIVELLGQESSSEKKVWNEFSLRTAMAGLENEEWPDYTAAPQFVKWSQEPPDK